MRPAGIILRIAFLGLVAVLFVAGGLFAWARSWTADRIAELSAGGEGIETEAGIQQVARHGSGARVLVIHGEAGGYDQALVLAGLLGLDDAEIIAPSRPGYLGTTLEVGDSFHEQAAAIAGLLKEFETGRLPVVAFGTGVPVALRLAESAPHLVDRLVLISGFYRAPAGFPAVFKDLAQRPFQQGLAGRLMQADPGAFTPAVVELTRSLSADGLSAAVGAIDSDPARSGALADYLATNLPVSPRFAGLSNDLKQLAAPDPLPANAPACPVLIIHGAADRMASAADASGIASKFPGAQAAIIPDAGHWPWIDAGWPSTQMAAADFLGFETGPASEASTPSP